MQRPEAHPVFSLLEVGMLRFRRLREGGKACHWKHGQAETPGSDGRHGLMARSSFGFPQCHGLPHPLRRRGRQWPPPHVTRSVPSPTECVGEGGDGKKGETEQNQASKLSLY